MQTQSFKIKNIPALLCGEPSEQVFLFVHGRCGCKEEALAFAPFACPKGWQVLAIDLPGHGERLAEPADFGPFVAIPELQTVLSYMQTRWQKIALYANSIGAWFSMLAFSDVSFERALLVSPLLDMNALIASQMAQLGVTPQQLEAKQLIPVEGADPLSWDYYCFAREHPIAKWNVPTSLLYAGHDNITSRATAEAFSRRFSCRMTVMEDGEHWFHTPEQLSVLHAWIEKSL